jgi:hypothetical protein
MRIIILLFLFFTYPATFCHSQNVDSLYITTSDSTRLFVKRSGSGYPVLFIHGGPGSNSFYFEKEGGDVFSKNGAAGIPRSARLWKIGFGQERRLFTEPRCQRF